MHGVPLGDGRLCHHSWISFDSTSRRLFEISHAADSKHLGARIGFMSVLHTGGSALKHHPNVHMEVP